MYRVHITEYSPIGFHYSDIEIENVVQPFVAKPKINILSGYTFFFLLQVLHLYATIWVMIDIKRLYVHALA